LKQRPLRFDTINKALSHIEQRMDIPMSRWMRNSAILKDFMMQRRIDDYV
jgi:hypothetical protein